MGLDLSSAMTLIILAAGTSKPFGEFPKQLLDVGGETLLERQVRQFGEHCHARHVATHRTEVKHPKCQTFVPSTHRWKCDTLLATHSIWCSDPRDKTIIIHGDVYFTDAAVKTIVLDSGSPISFFWNNGIEGMEAYGVCFTPLHNDKVIHGAYSVVQECAKNNAPPHDGGLMRMMDALEHMGVWIDKIPLTDGTRDFDHPHKHAEWRKAMGLK